jgi:branched-chain amino acid transport system substrate-binding protein
MTKNGMLKQLMRGSAILSIIFATLGVESGIAGGTYDVGASDTEIKLGQTMPYSGPASQLADYGRVQLAYMQMINDQGGVNGRKINLISLDDGYSPPKTVEQVRRLVEQDEVLALYSLFGTPGNAAVQKYLNLKKIPQLLSVTGITRFSDPKNFPWTMAYLPSYQSEMFAVGRYIRKTFPDKKIAVFWQNDDLGKDYLLGLKKGLGDLEKNIVADASYQVSDPTVDSQVVQLKSSGASILVVDALPKFAAQALRKAFELNWDRDGTFVAAPATSVEAALRPAGFERVKGVIAAGYVKDPSDPQWKNSKDYQEYATFMAKYMPGKPIENNLVAAGYGNAAVLIQVLKQCGDNITRENLIKQAANLKDFPIPMLLPGINANTSPDDYFIIEQLQMQRFDGEKWVSFGDLVDASELRQIPDAKE